MHCCGTAGVLKLTISLPQSPRQVARSCKQAGREWKNSGAGKYSEAQFKAPDWILQRPHTARMIACLVRHQWVSMQTMMQAAFFGLL